MGRPGQAELEALATGPLDSAMVDRLLEDPFLAEQVIDIRTESGLPLPVKLLKGHSVDVWMEIVFLSVFLPLLLIAFVLII